MEKFSRVLTVLVAVLSVAFMGFAGVVSFGGPNWEAEARAMEGYTFSRSSGEAPLWSVTRAEGREELSTKSPLLPAVIAAAIQDRTQRAQARLQELNEQIPQLEQQNKALAAMQDVDVPALEQAFQAQSKRLADAHAAIDATSQQQKMISDDIRKTEEQLASRREDVFRLELEDRVLDADVERVKQNVAVVEEQIRLIEDELDKVHQRKEEFDRRGLPPAQPYVPFEANPNP